MLIWVPLALAAFFAGEVAYGVDPWLGAAVCALAVGLCFARWRESFRAMRTFRRITIGIACFLFAFGFGAWQAQRAVAAHTRCDHVLAAFDGRSIVVNGILDESQSLTQRDIIGRVRVTTLASSDWKAVFSFPSGDNCVMRVRLPFGTEITSLSVRLSGSVRRGWLSVRRFQVREEEDGAHGGGFLFSLQRSFSGRFLRLFPGSAGGFMIGILAGGVSHIGPDVVADFRQTGLTHIVAVSGYNVSLVLQLLMPLALWVPRRFRGFVLLFPLGFFTAFSGFSASAVRAAVMGGMGVLGGSFSRPNSAFFAVLWSAAIMTVFSPLIFLQDRGFQLSFLATVAVLYVSPFLESCVVAFFSGKGVPLSAVCAGFLNVFLPTLSVYLLTLPVMAAFGRLPLIGLVTNLVFVAAVPWFMLVGAAVFLISCIVFPFAQFLASFVSIFLRGYFFLVHFFAKIPYGTVSLDTWSSWVILAYYAAIFTVLTGGLRFLRERPS